MRSWLQRLFRREQPSPGNAVRLICMRQADTWTWPAHLGAQTAGVCVDCEAPVFFEKQNAPYRKVCTVCAGLPSVMRQKDLEAR